ncbi:glycosyltransferase family 4 protein [Thiocystis violacea]|uniref:glycosyltransferase family 4 protein n=1 Tax=Thiocystis violacea TaxID=13725 RepID=UPI001908B41F|nr:glycosyltransferase family 4 protein [Thiocystis violacea]MBK1720385.1 hypothetical protein [Thiocystis violacea]
MKKQSDGESTVTISDDRPLTAKLRKNLAGRFNKDEAMAPDACARSSADPRVLHLSTLDCAGAGVAAYRLHTGLRRIGLQSSMCVLHKATKDPTVHVIQGIQDSGIDRQIVSLWPHLLARWGHTLRNFPNRSRTLSFFSTPDAIVPIKQQVKNADIINMHWVAGMLDIQAMPELFRGKKLFWTLHDMNPFTGGCHYAQDCRRYEQGCHHCPQLGPGSDDRDLVREIWILKRDHYDALNLTVITPSRWLGQCSQNSLLLGRFPHRVIPYGLDLEEYFPLEPAQARQQLGLPQDAHVILFGASEVGDYRKGFDLFRNAIDSLAQLTKNKPQGIILAAFGQSGDLDSLKTPYRFHALGHLDTASQLRAAYSAANVFVIPTREDNLPNTVLESMACGTPVVAFDLGGLPDMIIHRQTGYLAPFPDVEEMARGIDWIIQQGAASFQQRCREHALQHYSLSKQAERYMALYGEIPQSEQSDSAANRVGHAR